MRKSSGIVVALASLGLVGALPLAAVAQDDEPLTFYVVTHGTPTTPTGSS